MPILPHWFRIVSHIPTTWLVTNPFPHSILDTHKYGPKIWIDSFQSRGFVSEVFQIKGMRWDGMNSYWFPMGSMFSWHQISKPQSQWVDTFLLSPLEVLRFFACPTVFLEKLADTSVVLVGFDPDLGSQKPPLVNTHFGGDSPSPGFIPDRQNMGQNMGQWRWWHTLSQWSTKTNNLGGFWGPTCQEPTIWYTHICTNTPCNQRCWGGTTCKLTSAHCKLGGQPQPLLIEVLDRRCSRRIHLVLLRNGFMIMVINKEQAWISLMWQTQSWTIPKFTWKSEKRSASGGSWDLISPLVDIIHPKTVPSGNLTSMENHQCW